MKCVDCQGYNLCLAVCLECSNETHKATYCLHCRTLPCAKLECPLGHFLLGKSPVPFMGVTADKLCHLCGMSLNLTAKTVLFDGMCGLEICDKCNG